MQGYSLPQVEAYLAAIDKQELARNRLALITARAAKAKPDQFKKILKEFS